MTGLRPFIYTQSMESKTMNIDNMIGRSILSIEDCDGLYRVNMRFSPDLVIWLRDRPYHFERYGSQDVLVACLGSDQLEVLAAHWGTPNS